MPRHIKTAALAGTQDEADAKVRATVEGIIADVKARGDAAVRELSERFDKWSPKSFRLSDDEIRTLVATGRGPTAEELAALIDASDVPVRRGLPAGCDVHDAYAACDLVVMSSTWEGFGNPVIESIAYRRPIVVGTYPVLDELRAFGVELLSVDEPDEALEWLRSRWPASTYLV